MDPKRLTPVPNKGGRPRVLAPRVPVTTWLPPEHFKRIADLSRKSDIPMSTILRNIVIFRLQDL